MKCRNVSCCWADGEVSGSVEEHLSVCADCRGLQEELLAITLALGPLPHNRCRECRACAPASLPRRKMPGCPWWRPGL